MWFFNPGNPVRAQTIDIPSRNSIIIQAVSTTIADVNMMLVVTILFADMTAVWTPLTGISSRDFENQ